MEGFSYSDRFYGVVRGGSKYAPLSLGAPGNLIKVDYSCFKKTLVEKVEAITVKKEHRKELMKAYGPGTKKLNVPI